MERTLPNQAFPLKTEMTLNQILDVMWNDYITLNPAARAIHELLTKSGESVLNDHIAFRTYNLDPVGLDQVAAPFIKFGYKVRGEYHFKEKKLFAKHYEPEDLRLPKIFISELKVEEFSTDLQRTVRNLVSQVNPQSVRDPLFFASGRPWKVSFADYELLARESEYAAWMAAFGYRPNHFTVNVNALQKFPQLSDLNDFLQKNGHRLNASGGLIKGTPEAMLEQSSTMARPVAVSFSDGVHEVPACYYEFAKRYPQKNGELYHGFIEKSADKIFESTNRSAGQG